MHHFCTISTADHLYKAHALFDSLNDQCSEVQWHVLVTDGPPPQAHAENIRYYTPTDISILPVADRIISKYKDYPDKLRWSLKPVFLHYLLDRICAKVIYIDNDIYFFNDPSFLFDLLDTYDILLTPHHYPRDPERNQNWLEANFRVGLYNAGFVGANKGARDTMIWWAGCCAYRCEKNALRGIFDDQKYLDLIPVMNEKAHIVRHKGCNVAEWNKDVISRTETDSGLVLDGQYPLIFVHFNGTTIKAIYDGHEAILRKQLDQYFSALKKYRSGLKHGDLYHKVPLSDKLKYLIWKFATDHGL